MGGGQPGGRCGGGAVRLGGVGPFVAVAFFVRRRRRSVRGLGRGFGLAGGAHRRSGPEVVEDGVAFAPGHSVVCWGHGLAVGLRTGGPRPLRPPAGGLLGGVCGAGSAQLPLCLPPDRGAVAQHRPGTGGGGPGAGPGLRADVAPGGLPAGAGRRPQRDAAGFPVRAERLRGGFPDALRHHHPGHLLSPVVGPGRFPHAGPDLGGAGSGGGGRRMGHFPFRSTRFPLRGPPDPLPAGGVEMADRGSRRGGYRRRLRGPGDGVRGVDGAGLRHGGAGIFRLGGTASIFSSARC